ncbi:uncharacterized protein K444DRAFT_596532 [Hyaloscypha bicolor E]|uniref:Rhodopsin domain-containing protein n=1 Tax=Hyaloscypha bicolor E TaxID=1095630 RepID=A0A2J6SVL4_9HELO|nr:uncharacterized protein K444DRAFT_596532 [Hyaloscypha bicolor E]PMD54804.1 hypothetical protein K444DRAFT_596532 [Hyaloscypha bicolor E]
MSETPFSIAEPSGKYPPFAVVTESDHSAWILIATPLCLSCILLFSLINLSIRQTNSVRAGLDEACLASATVLACIQSSVVLGACAKGLGKSIELLSDRSLIQVQQMYYVSNLLFVVSLGLSKISVAFLLLRLTPQKGHMRILYGIITLMAVWTVASTFTVALQCNLSRPWILIQESCPGVFLRLKLISGFDIAFELSLVGVTINLVSALQAALDIKWTVIFTFSMRLPLIIAIGFRLATFNVAGLTTNPTILQAEYITWTQTELAYSIIAATIPRLRPFIKKLATNYGASPANGYGAGHANETGGDQQSGSFQMLTLRPKGKGDEYNYRIWSGGVPRRNNGASVDSQRMIIKKDLVWEVDPDPNRRICV